MDEVHIILDIYMDEVGMPMLISMSQYKNGDQGSKNGSQSIHTTGITQWWPQRKAKYKYRFVEMVHGNNGILLECNITINDVLLNLKVYTTI